MLVTGAGGFARQLIEAIDPKEYDNLLFFDHDRKKQKIFDKFEVIHVVDKAFEHFEKVDNRYCIGIGVPRIRKKMNDLFKHSGATLTQVISPKANVSQFVGSIDLGVSILPGAIIEGEVDLGLCCLINVGAMIAHECTIGDYTEVAPSVNISGNCTIGKFGRIGTGATLIPGITIGDNVTVGAGAVVTESFGDNLVLAGVPARPV